MSSYKICRCPMVGTGHVCKVVPKSQPGLSRSATKSSIYVAPNGELVAPDSSHLSPGETSALVALGSYYQNNERRLRHQLQDFPHHSYPAFWGYTRDFFLGNDPKYYYAPYMRSQLLSPHYHW
ncbi:hypothetical protein DdX_22321 [Ditylenchus destructor]|uniref:Uncharacterized protein n=1 Tax=Ditylenchus destructor TaxID=166010 RepID=A0AAD4QUW0_9BILA|nr:hypothetical protein DdX_22321 [Ditylenchus destructor]